MKYSKYISENYKCISLNIKYSNYTSKNNIKVFI